MSEAAVETPPAAETPDTSTPSESSPGFGQTVTGSPEVTGSPGFSSHSVTPEGSDTPDSSPESSGDGWAEKWVNPDGTFKDGWNENLPTSLGESASALTFKSVDDLARSFVSTKQMLGKMSQKWEAPADDATPEQIQEWKEHIGAPLDAAGYGDLKPEGIGDDIWDNDRAKDFIENVALPGNMSKEAVAKAIEWQAKAAQDEIAGREQKVNEYLMGEEKSLRQEWGSKYDEMFHMAQRAIATGGGDLESPDFNNAAVYKAFAGLAQKMGEDHLLNGETTTLSQSQYQAAKTDQDPSTNTQRARAYRGELGQEAQEQAQRSIQQDLSRGK